MTALHRPNRGQARLVAVPSSAGGRVAAGKARVSEPGGSAEPRVAFLDDGALVAGVRARNHAAMAELHDRFAALVLRVLARILGADRDLADLHHDAFVRALESIEDLRDPGALKAWMTSVAVHTARGEIERRTRRRKWLFFAADDELPEPPPVDPREHDDAREAVRATYAILEGLPADDRIAFALRFIDGMELSEVADACGVSLASIKRHLARAETRFLARARRTPALESYLEGGTRWTDR